MIEIRYQMREKDISALTQHQVKNTDSFKKGLRRHKVVLPLVLLAVALVSWTIYKDVVTAVMLAMVGIIWAIASPFYIRWGITGQVKKMYTKDMWQSMTGIHTLKATPSALVDISPTGESTTPWDEILRTERTRKYAFIFYELDVAQIVPLETLNEGNIDEFIDFVDGKIEEADKFAERRKKNKNK